MVTTMASGDISGYVGCSDITVMPSVVDVAGINTISLAVLSNAAAAIAGMALWRPPPAAKGAKPTVAISMFGVTTPCCDAVRKQLEASHEVLTFHATGAGGKAMEKRATSGMLAGVVDLTTTEIADEVSLLAGVGVARLAPSPPSPPLPPLSRARDAPSRALVTRGHGAHYARPDAAFCISPLRRLWAASSAQAPRGSTCSRTRPCPL